MRDGTVYVVGQTVSYDYPQVGTLITSRTGTDVDGVITAFAANFGTINHFNLTTRTCAFLSIN